MCLFLGFKTCRNRIGRCAPKPSGPTGYHRETVSCNAIINITDREDAVPPRAEREVGLAREMGAVGVGGDKKTVAASSRRNH